MKLHGINKGRKGLTPLLLVSALFAGVALVALPAIGVAPASSASATIPSVKGEATCNPLTGKYDIAWTVSGDTGAPKETATIVSQSRATSPTLVNATVKNTSKVTGSESVSTIGTYTLEVKVQWTNHAKGDLVTNRGSVKVSGTCAMTPPVTPPTPPVEPPLAECIDQVSWAYTYDQATGSGVVTVASSQKAQSDKLCNPLAVRSAAWTYDLPATSNPSWPQTLHGYNDVLVDKLGSFNYAAPVLASCYQYDTYAAWMNKGGFDALGLPDKLNGPSNPYEPAFLHTMLSGNGPNPTYASTTSDGCNTPPVVVPPVVTPPPTEPPVVTPPVVTPPVMLPPVETPPLVVPPVVTPTPVVTPQPTETPAPPAAIKPPAAPPTTPVVEVKPASPSALASTGVETGIAITLTAAMLLGGMTLMVASAVQRRRRKAINE